MLSTIEADRNIEIIYAAECGMKEWSLDIQNSNHEICFIYIRNDKSHYSMIYNNANELKNGYFHGQDANIEWVAFDLIDLLASALGEMHPLAVEFLFSSNVYRNSDKYTFVKQMKRALLEQPMVASLFELYRSMAQSSFELLSVSVFDDDLEDFKQGRVFLDEYLTTIREVAMVEWIKQTYVAPLDWTTHLLRPTASMFRTKLVETNFTVILNDIKPHLNSDVYNKLVILADQAKDSTTLTKVTRIKEVDEWIERTIVDTSDALLLIQAHESKLPDATVKFYQILKANLRIKFTS